MRKFYLLFALMLLTTGVTQVKAETLTATFDRNVGLPAGWSLVGDVTNDDTRGRNNSYGLWTSSKSTSANYVITEAVEGTFEFYARAYNKSYASTVVVYEYTGSGLGEQLYTTGSMYTSSTPTWSKYSFNVANGTQLAIVLNYAAIDDVTYTQYQQSENAELAVEGYACGDTYDFGHVAAGTTKTFTLNNRGLADLNISSIDVTGGFTITEGANLTTIAGSGSATLTVATPDEDATGDLTITSDDANSPYVISLTSTYKAPAPIMGLDMTTVAFGKVTADAEQVITVSNTGDAELTATIASDNADFTVAPASVTVAEGATATFTVTYAYDAEAYGPHAATITVTPNAGEAQTIAVSAIVQDPNVWTEDFEGNALPEGWTADANWSFSDGVAHGKYAYGSTKYYLTTPALTVVAGDELTFNYKRDYDKMIIEYKKDGGEWTQLYADASYTSDSDWQTYTISGLEAGSYQFRFVNGDYDLDNFEGFKLDNNAPAMEVTPAENADFGKVTAVVSKTYTVANTGTGELVVNIASDNEVFVVEPATLTVTDEPQTFTVTFNYTEGNYGNFGATITVTPTYNETAAVTIEASAIAKDPNVWEEDFEIGEFATGWDNEGGWKVSTPTASGSNGTMMATISSYNNPKALTTPYLEAKAGDQLSFYIGMQYDDEPLTIEYTNDDRATWNTIEEGVASYTASGTITFTAPADGNYYLRFTGTYAMLDNFYGFKPVTKDHDIAVSSYVIPATFNQYVETEVSVTLKELAGKDETVSVMFVVGEIGYGTEEIQLAAGEEKTVTIPVTFEDAGVTGPASFLMQILEDGPSFNSDEVEISVVPAPALDETVGTLDDFTNFGSYPVVVLNYMLKAGWNTIILPFAVSDLTVFGENAKAYEFSGYTDGAMNFNSVTSLNAQTPYVLYATEAMSQVVFYDVTNFRTSDSAEDLKVSINGATFQGTYVPVEAPNMAGKYGVVPTTGRIAKGGSNASIKGFRAFFELPEGAQAPVANFSDGGVVNSIEAVELGVTADGEVYDLSGRKMNTRSLKSGVYVKNGKKVIVK